jgi:homoserine kinase type II
MSVFTAVTKDDLARWLGDYAVGRLVSFEGIAAGVQNSNFFVTTTLGRYVLTLFETIGRADLPYYLHLTAHLAHHGLPVPAPVANRYNEYLGTLSDRPAALVRRLSGCWLTDPAPAHCARVGAMLAGLHLAGQSYGRRQPHPRGAAWRTEVAGRVVPHLGQTDADLLHRELTWQAGQDFGALPQGVIHADLFRDNVLWDGERIGGVIDFYFAGTDALLFDLAVTVNDWCTMADGSLDAARAHALLEAYGAERAYTEHERRLWPAALRAAALRFWLSRLEDLHLPRTGEMVQVKDPGEYRDILRARIDGEARLPDTP